MKKIVLMSLIILFEQTLYGYKPIFTSLNEINEDARNADEHPPLDNKDWVNPDFTKFIKKRIPSWWDETLFKLHIKSWPLWHIEGFKDLLFKTIASRENDGYVGKFVITMRPDPGAVFVIWGDIQGAYHSLVRALNQMRSLNIISNDLYIIKPNYYFVFNGNVIDQSAYSLEVLTIIMRLMDNNPGRVFYLRGQHEDQGRWKDFSLKRDLVFRVSLSPKERFELSGKIPLSDEMDRFFDTLPLALYLIGQDVSDIVDVVRISYFGRDHKELEMAQEGLYLGDVTGEPRVLKLHTKKERGAKKFNVKAIVKGESNLTSYYTTLGLSQIEADKGSTSWIVFSSPTDTYRHLQDFYYDAFAFLEIGKIFSQWTISLYNQDVREMLGFKRIATYNVMNGLKEIDGLSKRDESEDLLALKKRMHIAEKQINEILQTCDLDLHMQKKENEEKVKE